MFYLKPPSGMTSLENLDAICTKRLQFLLQLEECRSTLEMKDLVEATSTVEGSDCLLEWTKKDRVSHFLLRFACCNDKQMTLTFISAETAFFLFRFSSMTEDELMAFFKNTKREIRHIETHTENSNFSTLLEKLTILKTIVSEYDLRELIDSYLGHDTRELRTISIPFQYVTELVTKRCVFLTKGVASVLCDKLHLVLKSVFQEVLRTNVAIAKMQLSDTLKDVRMTRLFWKLKVIYERHQNISSPASQYPVDAINFDEVDILAENYPLCMRLVHRSLREKHRLAHHSRIVYTLFLKEIGLTVHESLKFWKREYSQSPLDGSTCSHGWAKEARRYSYSIRHLYGLEGSRINYRGHSCSALQSMSLSPRDVACCPFSYFNGDDLHNVLDMEDIPEHHAANIMDLSKQGLWSEACGHFFIAKTVGRMQKSSDILEKIETADDGENPVSQCLKQTQDFFASQSDQNEMPATFDLELDESGDLIEKKMTLEKLECKAEDISVNRKIYAINERLEEDEHLAAKRIKLEIKDNEKTGCATLEHGLGNIKQESSSRQCIASATNVIDISVSQVDCNCPKGSTKDGYMVKRDTSRETYDYSNTNSQTPSTSNCDTPDDIRTKNESSHSGHVQKVRVEAICDKTIGAIENISNELKNEISGAERKCAMEQFPSDTNFKLRISKPADYFVAYRNLVEKLGNLKTEND